MPKSNSLMSLEAKRFADAPPAPPQERTAFHLPSTVGRFDRAEFQLASAADDEVESTDGRPTPQPFSMLARTGSPIIHWYWGQIVHDMSGFVARKDTVPIDYCHDPEQVLGFANKQVAKKDGLHLSGKIIPFTKDDRASEVLHKGKSGVPYEASISFDYAVLEWIPQDAKTKVNGEQFAGPGYIVREWTIAGSAVCPYGADGNTSTSFATDQSDTRSVTIYSMDPGSGETIMSTKTDTPPVPETKPETATALSADQVKAGVAAEIKAALTKFTTKFGAENGAKWFGEDKTYEQALELHADSLTADIKRLTSELEAANTKLANAPKGEVKALSTSDAEKGGKPDGKPSEPLKGVARFAASLSGKMPVSKSA